MVRASLRSGHARLSRKRKKTGIFEVVALEESIFNIINFALVRTVLPVMDVCMPDKLAAKCHDFQRLVSQSLLAS